MVLFSVSVWCCSLCLCSVVLCVCVVLFFVSLCVANKCMHTCMRALLSLFYLQNNPADNLLSEDTFRKWSCANAGEKQASVVLQVTVILLCIVLSSEELASNTV